MAVLPTVTTTFVGRAQELAAIKNLVVSARLITLTGPGGSGKTRLAIESAQALASEFQDGVAWVDLAPLADPGLVVNAVGLALDLREQPEHSLLETLIAFLKTKQFLLVLDNCEHLLTASRSLTEALLRACPDVQIVATSREPLAQAGETVYVVNPLALPPASSPQAALESEAVRLFALRAAEVLPGFVLDESNLSSTVRICERLDGLPLAIEFAAARVKLLTVHEIAERLDDRFLLLTRSPTVQVPRHQTLRAAMEWSYNLLAPSEQVLFRQLAVFAGSFTLDAVETVCGDGLHAGLQGGETSAVPAFSVLDLVAALAEKSLLIVAQREEGAPTRYGMLETVREYAREKLAEANEADPLRNRHLTWYRALGERARAELFGADAARCSARLRKERDNLHNALRWSIASHQTEAGLQLASALWIAWELWSDYSEGIYWIEALLAKTPAERIAPAMRANALTSLAALLYRRGNLPRAQHLAKQSLEMVEGLDDPTISRGFITNLLGVMASDNAQFAEAIEYFERARAFYLQENQPGRSAGVLHNLGQVAQRQGRLAAAASYLQERAAIAREIGDRIGLTLTLNSLGEIETDLGHYDLAEALARESLDIAHELQGALGVSDSLRNLASVLLYRGDTEQALRLATEALALGNASGIKRENALAQTVLGDVASAQAESARALEHYQQALALYHELDNPNGIALATGALARVELQLGHVDRAAALLQEGLTLLYRIGNPLYIARGLEGTSEFAIRRGDPVHAAQFLGAADFLRAQAGTPPHVNERVRINSIVQHACGALGERAFETTRAHGRALAPEQMLDAALAFTGTAHTPVVEPPPRPALEIIGFGDSIVRRDGTLVSSADWTYLKSKELFFYLLSNPAATKAQIGLVLWAEASPAQLRSNFHRTMHHLRKALAHPDWITFENERYGVDPSLHYWFDVQTFETQLEHARQLAHGDSTSQTTAIQALVRAIDLYRGDFLADLDGGDWIVLTREELRKQFLDALLTLGQLYFEQADYPAAQQIYQRVLTHDNYLEIAHREIMRCLARQGEVAQALRHYRTLSDLLLQEVGAPPSSQTTALYQRLKRGEPI